MILASIKTPLYADIGLSETQFNYVLSKNRLDYCSFLIHILFLLIFLILLIEKTLQQNPVSGIIIASLLFFMSNSHD